MFWGDSNMNMRRPVLVVEAAVICALLLFSIGNMAIGSQSQQEEDQPYEGHLLVYIVEPESRWNMANQQPYHYAMLDMAFDDALSITYLDTYEDTITWSGDVSEDNIMVMAAVFNPVSHQGYAYPPSSNPFDAYYVDAAAAAYPGETGYNTVNEDFTHTVFIEEGSATWCGYCPAMANTIKAIYDSGDYPFYFVALVDDKSPDATNRLRNDYNIYGFPTAFFDGGRQLLVGGVSTEPPYRTRIESCGSKDVHGLNLSVSLQWLGSGNLEINISITNNEIIHYPETPDKPTGSASGKVGEAYTYCTTTTDPDGDQVYYFWDWGDGTDSGWLGPYDSGVELCTNHSWDQRGVYEIRVKAKDTSGLESPWSDPLSVSMPKSKYMLRPTFANFLEKHPHPFPIIRMLLNV